MAGTSTWSRDGCRAEDGALLAGALEANFPSVDIPKECGAPAPKITGGFDEWIKANPHMESQAYNEVKKCSCGKPCAVTMALCNACGASLQEIEVSKSPNLFVAFIYGVDKASFPLRISMRLETKDMMVFDDPLAITRAHVLAVPTNVYCPDIRSLFVDPARAVALLKKMEAAAWTGLQQGPLASEVWRRKALSPEGNAMHIDALRDHVVMAFNLPPSQYQLHLQYMLPPLLPSHLGVFRKGAHFMKMRHFPLAYVLQALEKLALLGESWPDAPQLTAQELVDKITPLGIDYGKAHDDDMMRLQKSNDLLANYDPADFTHAVKGDEVTDKHTRTKVEGVTAKDLDGKDKLVLQGYGRPYEGGKPGGVYYMYPRDPEPLPTLSTSSACCDAIFCGAAA
mmetsp:Transcript_39983/g.95444  ORF Transcript_39983/g.95444 Transcript_39983/m.95444 type:complete len:397 (-) Transcript_39983:190-1380(-)|eukprot:CAMPEP_0181443478 /NCGR_PEP_ID=MMETSP1110-20121109/24575_1 /TAXON_ID=174948 /ORGANISM="Symbiodinium sp., Strain CCMP421" /LENGTH=396 /DNA_ID=CAMNT_0023567457 /DNA_START=38 /DNA_END=1228 /DNA_ORIENTATION=-